MARIEAEVHVEAVPERVWARLVDWERQPEWMVDALDVTVLSPHRQGPGVRLRCPTRLAGVVVTDVLEVVEWQPPRHLGIRHDGWLIQGLAGFDLQATDHGTHLRWWEEIQPPLGVLGDVGMGLAEPLTRRLLQRSLANLKLVAEGFPLPPAPRRG